MFCSSSIAKTLRFSARIVSAVIIQPFMNQSSYRTGIQGNGWLNRMSKSRATTRHLRVEQSQGVYIHDLKLVDAPMYSLTILSSSAVEIGYVSIVAADQVWHCNSDHSCKPDTCRERLMESVSPVHKFTYITFQSRIEMSVSVSRTQRKTFWWRISCVIKVGP